MAHAPSPPVHTPMPTTPARPLRLLAVGGICATRILRVPAIPPAPAKVLADAGCEVVDGMALSAAFAFAKLGGRAALWARAGDDAGGHAMRNGLAAEGIDVRGLRLLPGARSSCSSVIVDGRGERLVVPFHDPGLDPDPGWLPLHEVGGFDGVHVDPRWPEGARAALAEARRAGRLAMLDADVAPAPVLDSLLPLASHAVFSDAGLFAYTGLDALEPALRQVARSHPGHVGASCGAAGYAWLEDGALHRVAAPVVPVVDTLAAGDVFHGALALSLLEGRAMTEAARFACAAASLKCSRFGGRLGCPGRAELDAFLGTGTLPA